ncbi:molybdopterin oxidoreductase family protein [soil metagenome]
MIEDTVSSTFVQGACPHDCPDTCAIRTEVRDGVAVRVSGDPAHPTTRGVLCYKVSRYHERTYHAYRVLRPLRRVGPKGSGQFEPMSWEEALDDIAARLTAIAARGAERIVPYSYAGTMGLVQGESMAARFFNKLGASRLARTICAEAGSVGVQYTLGMRVGPEMQSAVDARVIVFWGANPIASNLHYWTFAQEARRRGATLVAIDPHRSLTAEKCALHVAPLPGTDAALALGIMHVLVREDWLDHDYIESHTLGFEQLRERVAGFDPDRVAQLCGITASEVEELARLMASRPRGEGPVQIRMNYGMQRAHGGGMAARNIACLPALTGDWRSPAGGVLLSMSGGFTLDNARLQRPELLAGRTPRTINMTTIGNALLGIGDEVAEAPIEALIVYNSNPVAIAPDSTQVVAGFSREDLFTVVLEHFMTDTADHADYVLPATTQLEHHDVLKPYGHVYAIMNHKAIEPLGEARSNTAIFRALAARMGFDEPCFADDDETIARQAFDLDAPGMRGMDWDELLSQGWTRMPFSGAEGGYAPFAEGGFGTPSGKCEFYSANMLRDGHDPLPAYTAPLEVGRDPQYPLAMISPPARNFLNSTFANLQSLRDAEGEPTIRIHPDDAASRRLASCDYVRVFNRRGSLRLKALVTPQARPGVVVALSIWWRKLSPDGKNANELSGQALTDMGDAPTFYDCAVQLEPDGA